MAIIEPVAIISDSPETVEKNVSFGFDAYKKTIADLIAFKENETPLVIGIYGEWGSGKTTLMRNIQTYLDEDTRYKNDNNYRRCKSVWFQVWKYSKEDEILAALIEEIFKAMEKDKFFEKCKGKIEKLTKGLDKKKIASSLIKLISGIDVNEFFRELEYKDKLGFYDTFQEFFDDLIWTYLNWRPQIKRSDQPDDKKGVLVIFIDDLDRCPEDRIVRVLETVKLFMDKKGCIFVIGAANDIIIKALRKTYEEDAEKFMDKIVQVTFNLPQIPKDDFGPFITSISKHSKKVVSTYLQYLHLILPAMQNNPRRLKRFLNNLNLQYGLLKNRKIAINFKHLILWNVIEYNYPSLWKNIVENENTRFFFTLQEKTRIVKERISKKKTRDISDKDLEGISPLLHDYIKDKELAKIVDQFDCKEEQLLQLITMSGIVESAEDLKEKKEIESTKSIGGMVKVPAGEFVYGDKGKKEKIEKPFEIDIYPVTNAQYKEFIQANGYSSNDYWTSEGIEWKDKNKIQEPKYWNDPKFNDPEQPVVGVSFYEAEAYAKWARKRLPFELEWEKAARGEDGREYPWGDEFDEEKCNSLESDILATTPVTDYPNGVSPYGCHDMVGNVWEWCQDLHSEPGSDRVIRGGGWGYNSVDCRASARGFSSPSDRNDQLGFRLARSLESLSR